MAGYLDSDDWQVVETRGDTANTWCYSYTKDTNYSLGPVHILLGSDLQRSKQHRSYQLGSNLQDRNRKLTSDNFTKGDYSVDKENRENCRVRNRNSQISRNQRSLSGQRSNVPQGTEDRHSYRTDSSVDGLDTGHENIRPQAYLRSASQNCTCYTDDTKFSSTTDSLNWNFDNGSKAGQESKDKDIHRTSKSGKFERGICKFCKGIRERHLTPEKSRSQRQSSALGKVLLDSGIESEYPIEFSKLKSQTGSVGQGGSIKSKVSLDYSESDSDKCTNEYQGQRSRSPKTERLSPKQVSFDSGIESELTTQYEQNKPQHSYSKVHSRRKISPINSQQSRLEYRRDAKKVPSKAKVSADNCGEESTDCEKAETNTKGHSRKKVLPLTGGNSKWTNEHSILTTLNQIGADGHSRKKIVPTGLIDAVDGEIESDDKKQTTTFSRTGEVRRKISPDSGIQIEREENITRDNTQDNNFNVIKIVANKSRKNKRLTKLRIIKQKQLELIDSRKAELTAMIDRWHEHLTKQVEKTYTEEEERLVNLDSSDTDDLVLSSMLSVDDHMLPKHFGSFQVHHVLRKHLPALAADYWAYQLGPARHIRTFETRDYVLSNSYMASSLVLTPSGDVLVADLGADTCRIFTRDGRLRQELDTYPFDDPTHAICHGGGYLVCCREGLKRFSIQGKYIDMISDIKCPQSVTMDTKSGHVIVSDMYDCGTVVVTIHRDKLEPIRFSCGSQYENEAVFKQAWHVYVTNSNVMLLTDRYDHTLKAYTIHGEFLWSSGGQGSKPGQLFNPAGITEDFLGNILVADSNNDRVQIWGSDGQWLGVVLNEGQISQPMDLATDQTGNVYVLQGEGKVVVYRYLCEL